jgi:hypothetical protein
MPITLVILRSISKEGRKFILKGEKFKLVRQTKLNPNYFVSSSIDTSSSHFM